MKKLFVCFVLFFLFSGVLFAQIRSGRPAWVSVRSAPVKASTWFFANIEGNLQAGTEVTVLRVNRNWVEIQSETPALSGWTMIGNLSPRLIVGEGLTATAREVALAAKGFDLEVEAEFRAETDLNYDGVNWMERIMVSQEALLRFMEEGRLNTEETNRSQSPLRGRGITR